MKKLVASTKEYLNNIRLNIQSAIRKHRIHKTIPHYQIEHLRKTITIKSEWHGSVYGGFYLLPCLNEQSIAYSFGIGKDITFDRSLINKFNCSVFAFDPTPKSIQWLKNQKTPLTFHFYEYGICSSISGYVDFYLPRNPRHVSGSLQVSEVTSASQCIKVQMKTFADIATELGHKHIDVLKMDIEGAEYDVLDSVINSGIEIDQILVEFHDRNFDSEEIPSKKIVEKLIQNGYELFAISKSYEEVSFVRKSLLNQTILKHA
jgi:FkbM family methyltransferase